MSSGAQLATISFANSAAVPALRVPDDREPRARADAVAEGAGGAHPVDDAARLALADEVRVPSGRPEALVVLATTT